MVLGTPRTFTPDQARNQAAAILAKVKLGADPAGERSDGRKADDVRDLLAKFMDGSCSREAESSHGKIVRWLHQEPHRARTWLRKAPALARADVERLHKAIGKTNPVTANRVIALIGAVYAYGLRDGVLPHGNHESGHWNRKIPLSKTANDSLRKLNCYSLVTRSARPKRAGSGAPKAHPKHAPKKPENRVTTIGPHAAAAIRLLIFTGARLREILDLKWEHVDLQRGLLFLPDSKTGKEDHCFGWRSLGRD